MSSQQAATGHRKPPERSQAAGTIDSNQAPQEAPQNADTEPATVGAWLLDGGTPPAGYGTSSTTKPQKRKPKP